MGVWRWTQKPDGKWQKPPYQARDPQRHASSTDPSTWSDYPTALAAVQAGHADGITYMLTADDPFAAIDLDHCRDPDTRSIDIWAQLFLERGRDTYAEVTPSGDGVRIWGLANGAALNRKFTLEIDGKKVAAELFRRTNKPLTITGYTLDPAIRELTSIDRTLDWAVIWGERRKAAAAPLPCSGNGFTSNGNGCGYSIDQIEQIVRAGAPAATIAAMSFTPSSAITPAALGLSSASTSICSSFPTGSARSTSAKAGLRWRFPAAFASGPSCRYWPAMSSHSGPLNG